MPVGLLLVTHDTIAPTLRDTLRHLLMPLPLAVETLEVPLDADLDAALPAASTALRRADSGGGVLLLTDLYGASPANLAARLAQLGTPVRRVSGLNLPMLLRVMNYADLELDALAAVAATGGRNGIVADEA